MATVTVRDFATFEANTPPPTSIWLSSQPPKMSPLALVSAGIASVRMQRSPLGSVLPCSLMPLSLEICSLEICSVEIVPARIGRKAPAESFSQRAQAGHHIIDAARARIVQRTAAERRIAGAEDHGTINRVAVVGVAHPPRRGADVG